MEEEAAKYHNEDWPPLRDSFKVFFFCKGTGKDIPETEEGETNKQTKKQLAGLVERLEDGIGSSDSEEDVPIVEPKMEEFCLLWGP